MLNHISIMGRLVADPELRYTPKGLAIGAVVSGACVAGVAGYLILVHIRRKKQQSAG